MAETKYVFFIVDDTKKFARVWMTDDNDRRGRAIEDKIFDGGDGNEPYDVAEILKFTIGLITSYPEMVIAKELKPSDMREGGSE